MIPRRALQLSHFFANPDEDVLEIWTTEGYVELSREDFEELIEWAEELGWVKSGDAP